MNSRQTFALNLAVLLVEVGSILLIRWAWKQRGPHA